MRKMIECMYAVTMDDVPIEKKIIERYQNASSVMVWGAVSSRGKLPLLYIEKGVKINQEYYLENVLKQHLLPQQHYSAKNIFAFSRTQRLQIKQNPCNPGYKRILLIFF